MNLIHDIATKTLTLKIDDPERAYSEINDLLSNRMSFDKVIEEKHYQDIGEGVIRAKINTVEGYDSYTTEKIEMLLTLKPDELNIEMKVQMVISYDAGGWKDNIIYYGYKALFHKYLHAGRAHHYEHGMEDKADELISRLKDLFV